MKLNFIKRIGLTSLLFLGNKDVHAAETQQNASQEIPQQANVIEYGTLRAPFEFDEIGFPFQLREKIYEIRLDTPSDFYENIKRKTESLGLQLPSVVVFPFTGLTSNEENLNTFNILQEPNDNITNIAERGNLAELGAKLFANIVRDLDALNKNTKIKLWLPENLRRDLENAHKRLDIHMCLLSIYDYESLTGLQIHDPHQTEPTPPSAPKPSRNSKAS